ncbi:MAG: ATP-binding protein, partial [Bacteroidota bacterium]
KTIEKTTDLPQLLQQIDSFNDIPISSLQWLIDQSNYVLYDVGEKIFSPGVAVDTMKVIIKGTYEVRFGPDRGSKVVGQYNAGQITGVLPFSRMKEAGAFGTAITPVYSLELHRQHFTEMVNVDYKMVQNLVARMSDRIRDFQHIRYQDEKLMSLGKLSAGLAHELNNPASAMVRSADELYKQIHSTPERFKNIITMRITPAQTDQINAILFAKIEAGPKEHGSLMEKEEAMDELLDWLEDKEIDHSEDIAETFLGFGMCVEELEKIEEISGGVALGTLLWWIESTLSLERLVIEIRESADRIAKLIKSIKSYSHMDRGVDREMTDIHKGIESTLTMLNHKKKQKNIQVDLAFDESLPLTKAFPSELNQVWTNLIDNAIDAMGQNGVLRIETQLDRKDIVVKIIDSGSGISQDVVNQIFDPFFTTKPMGMGTGLGLDVVQKIINHHKGDIKVTSEPGNTVFSIRLPIL